VKKASEYREHARECRVLAAAMESEKQKQLMLQMADHWEKLAADRSALIDKHPELACPGDRQEARR
jgi:chromosome segregation ATPase